MTRNNEQTQPWGTARPRQDILNKQATGKDWQVRGSGTYNATLTPQDVQTIRELWALGVSQRTIAKAYNLAQPHVCNIIRRKKWSHVPPTDKERTELGCQVETQHQAIATTGRIQQWNGKGWDTFNDIRRAEIATGQDRCDIAQACLSGGKGWRYEPGIAATPEPDLW